MAQFVFLYIGEDVPASQQEQNQKDWYSWMDSLGKTGKVVQMGAPFEGMGRVLYATGNPKPYDGESHSNVTGYTIIEAANLEEAVSLTKGCPQINPEYGHGSLEVRGVIPM